MKRGRIVQLVSAIAVCEFAGVIGAVWTSRSVRDWYVVLHRPPLNPPSWIFGPVWTVLYAMMGVSVFLVLQSDARPLLKRHAIRLFSLQLFLNALWSFLFFGLRSPIAGSIEIVLLWLAIVWTMVVFRRISRLAMWLLVPYVLWVTFAAYLNIAIWTLNR